MEKNNKITIALAGNANVGKSVIFNYLTGLHQHIGNWPGKTVEKREGTLNYKGYTIDVFDLPGIYSLATFSIEEEVSRQFFIDQKPDVIINVIDATNLERNLIFTLQLLELGLPIIIALNQMDLARVKGIKIDVEKLSATLGLPAIKTIATKGKGVDQIIEEAVKTVEKKSTFKAKVFKYGKEVEEVIQKLTKELDLDKLNYPSRWAAIKVLEDDKKIKAQIKKNNAKIIAQGEDLSEKLSKLHGHSTPSIIKAERAALANQIASRLQKFISPVSKNWSQRINDIMIHKFWGYPILIAIVTVIFFGIFKTGDYFSGLLGSGFKNFSLFWQATFGTQILAQLFLAGIDGFLAGISIALPYLIPFYIVFGLLESSGYMSRIAFLVDSIMHRMGLHGKAFIPIILGYGCNVPAILGCRIMETERERLICGFTATLIPCAARTIIIFGLVGKFVGLQWAIALYVIDLLIVFLLGRASFKILPGEPTGLIMEMHDLRLPDLKHILKRTWQRTKVFIRFAVPLIIIGSIFLKLLEIVNLLEPISNIFSPVIVHWLGLPAVAGLVLIFGILRKELALIMLATFAGTTNFATILSPLQMFVFALVSMLYVPCIATIAVLIKEFGWPKAMTITVFEIVFAIFTGGIAFRLLANFL